jgi:hypothetical protein
MKSLRAALCVASVICWGVPARAQASGSTALAEAVRAAEARTAECDAADKATTMAGRVCQDAATLWLAAAEQGRVLAQASNGEVRQRLVDDAAAARYNAAALLMDIRACDEALPLLGTLAAAPEVQGNATLRDRVARNLAAAQSCMEERQVVSRRPEPAPRTDAPTTTSVDVAAPGGDTQAPSVARRANWLPWTVAGVGGAVLAGAVGWDAALATDRDTESKGGSACETDGSSRGCTDYLDARTSIEDAKTPITVMYVGGLLFAAGGVTWALLRDDDGSEVSLSPLLGPGEVGLTGRVSW